MTMATFDKYDDTIDSRDVIARIEELEAERDALDETVEEMAADYNRASYGEDGTEHDALIRARKALEEWDDDNADELRILKALADEASGYAADWRHGEALIRDSYFKDYAMELAKDIGAINRGATWPNTCIDWDQAAGELKMDYSAVDFDGVTYWIR